MRSDWNLPPGVTSRMIEEQAGAFDDHDECSYCDNPSTTTYTDHFGDVYPLCDRESCAAMAKRDDARSQELDQWLDRQERTRCECGAPGRWPYPIGGGVAYACDDCRKLSEASADPESAGTEDWDRWAETLCPPERA